MISDNMNSFEKMVLGMLNDSQDILEKDVSSMTTILFAKEMKNHCVKYLNKSQNGIVWYSLWMQERKLTSENPSGKINQSD